MTRPYVQVEPWERSLGEPSKAFAKFALYRNMGPTRSLARVGEVVGVGTARCEALSAKWGWVARAQAWDAEQDRLARLEVEEETREMHRRHVRLAMAMANKAGARLVGGKVLVGGQEVIVPALDPSKLTVTEVVRLVEAAVRIERLARDVASAAETPAASHDDEYALAARLMQDPSLMAMAEKLAAELHEEEPVDRKLYAVS
jgi:hypothetical protein